MALGPSRPLGSGIFKYIKEIPPASYLIFRKDGIKMVEYWKPKAERHTENLGETTEHVRFLVLDAIKRQLVSDVPVCSFLSGGLDSSAISSIAASEYKENGKTLDTYSIDYTDNDAYFKPSTFIPSSDNPYIDIMRKYINSNHKNVIIDNVQLA